MDTLKIQFKTLIKLFLTFLKISPITFGGGYAMISLIQVEVIQKNNWLEEEDLLDIITVSQSIPGAIAINAAIFIGYRVAGIAGAMFSLLGIVLPTIFIVVSVSIFYFFFKHNPIVSTAFNGIGAAVIALILYAAFIIGKTSIVDKTTWIIMILSIIILLLFSINPILVIIGGIAVGIGISKVRAVKKVKAKDS